jgi:hypothetical protein
MSLNLSSSPHLYALFLIGVAIYAYTQWHQRRRDKACPPCSHDGFLTNPNSVVDMVPAFVTVRRTIKESAIDVLGRCILSDHTAVRSRSGERRAGQDSSVQAKVSLDYGYVAASTLLVSPFSRKRRKTDADQQSKTSPSTTSLPWIRRTLSALLSVSLYMKKRVKTC